MKTINNNITEDYSSFEVSKLLKEKGFEVKSDLFFNEGSGWKIQSDFLLRTADDKIIEKPTHAVAIKWIRENFRIHIYIDQHLLNKCCYHLTKLESFKENSPVTKSLGFSEKDYDSVSEATEAALLYTLKNLI